MSFDSFHHSRDYCYCAMLRLSTEQLSAFMRAKYVNNCIFMQKDKLRDFAAHLAVYKSLRLLPFFKERINRRLHNHVQHILQIHVREFTVT